LVKLLQWNRVKLADFEDGLFEQSFGMKEFKEHSWEAVSFSNDAVKISFRGKIDKVLINHNTKTIYATDYKTGSENKPKDIVDMFSSQMVIYCLVLNDFFPEYRICMAYEKIKSLKQQDHGLTKFYEKIPDNELLILDKKNTVDLSEMKEKYLNLAKKVTDGEFSIAEKSRQQKACTFCDYERICRKNTYN
jgi:ATP-dependent helicase/DNAse subunit B